MDEDEFFAEEETRRKTVFRGYIDNIDTNEDGVEVIGCRLTDVRRSSEWFASFPVKDLPKRWSRPGELYYGRGVTWIIDNVRDKDHFYLRRKVFYWKKTKDEQRRINRKAKKLWEWLNKNAD